jgi:hypothetical protein
MLFYGKAAMDSTGKPAALYASSTPKQLTIDVCFGVPAVPSLLITSPHRSGARATAAASPVDGVLSTSHQLRIAVEKEETEQRHELFAMFLYEQNNALLEAKLLRRAQEEAIQQLRQVNRKMKELLEELEPRSRASVRILEEKCCAALVHVLSLERAVLACGESMHIVCQTDARRRHFLIQFQERELKELVRKVSVTLWRPGMKCFGPCPFQNAFNDCPFRDKELYGLRMSEGHFLKGGPAIV